MSLRLITEEEIRTLQPKLIQLQPIKRPDNPSQGLLYSDLDDRHLYYFDGQDWQQLDFAPGPH